MFSLVISGSAVNFLIIQFHKQSVESDSHSVDISTLHSGPKREISETKIFSLLNISFWKLVSSQKLFVMKWRFF